jgi:hypothetical protein
MRWPQVPIALAQRQVLGSVENKLSCHPEKP